jgi:hypothetical protein
MNKIFFKFFTYCYLLMMWLLCIPANTPAATQYGSLAVGVTGQTVDGQIQAGIVQIVNGSKAGLTPEGNTIFNQGGAGITDEPEASDFFGNALATGDFNNDGFPDLAVGVYNESISDLSSAGVVHIIYGTKSGLTSAGNKLIRQGLDGIVGIPEAHEWFGLALTTGDFNGDGFSDLVVGAPLEDVFLEHNAGKIYVMYGSSSGLTSTDNRMFRQEREGLVGSPEPNDEFGAQLASGDFNNDGFCDVAVGVPGQKIDGRESAGAVHIIYGSGNGLTSVGNRIWSRDSPLILGSSGQDFAFGRTITSGDFNNDGFSDIVIGASGEVVSQKCCAGAINILYGSQHGITAEGNQYFNQNSPGIFGEPEILNWFGGSLASGDFNNDGCSDIAIGVMGQDIETVSNAGVVQILYGSQNGVTILNARVFHQKMHGIIGLAEANDDFGFSLATGDFNMDGFYDLAVGVPYDDLNGLYEVGGVNIFYGSGAGLTNDGEQYVVQNSYGMLGESEQNDYFGHSLVYLPGYKDFPWAMFLPAINTGNGVSPP